VSSKKQPPVAEPTGGHRQHHRIDDVDIAGAAGWQSKPSANRQKENRRGDFPVQRVNVGVTYVRHLSGAELWFDPTLD
jgi:hypothetical protein